MIVGGIDVGLGGAVALLNGRGVVMIEDMPVFTVTSGKRRRQELDLGGLRRLLTSHPIDHLAVELVASRPQQGVSSVFKFGTCYGAVLGMVSGLEIPYTLIPPQRWQRIVGCGPSPDEARRRVGQLYPDAVQYLTRKRDAGRADAILIARSGLMTLRPAQSQVAQ